MNRTFHVCASVWKQGLQGEAELHDQSRSSRSHDGGPCDRFLRGVVEFSEGRGGSEKRCDEVNFTSGNNCSITSLDASTGSPNLVLLAIALVNGSVQSAPVFNTTPAQTFTQIGTMVGTNNIGELFVYRLGPSITGGTASITIFLVGCFGMCCRCSRVFWCSFGWYASYKFL